MLTNFVISQVRYRNGSKDVTPRQFCRIYKTLLVQQIMDPSRGKNTNCRDDGGIYWDIFNQVDFTKISPLNVQEESDEYTTEAQEKSDQELTEHVQEQDTEEYILSHNHGDVKYASYLSRRLIHNAEMCIICVKAFSIDKEEREEQHSILDLTEDPGSTYSFIACTRRVQILVHKATKNFMRVLQTDFSKIDLGARLARAIRSTIDFDYLKTSCGIHGQENKNFMVKVMIRSLQRFVLKLENKKLVAPLEKSRALAKIASLATSSQKVPRLFSGALIFGKKRVTAARPLLM